MAEAKPNQFSLASLWEPEDGRYTLVLTNHSDAPLVDFQLGVSGPLYFGANAIIDNGRLVRRLASFYEFAPPPGHVLAAGAEWRVAVSALNSPLRHWTDGAVSGFVVRADGTIVNAHTRPAVTADTTPYQRGTMRYDAAPGTRISIVPWPNAIDVAGRRTAPDGLSPEGDEPAAIAASAHFAELTALLFPGEGLCRAAREGGLPVRLTTDPDLPAGRYSIGFGPHGAHVTGRGADELLHGLITLGQIARGARHAPDQFDFPLTGQIDDSPAHGFRGCHIDVARRFYSLAELSRFTAILAWNKLNVLHLHLSDDEAWRVEIAAYPRLTELGGWRGYGLALPPLLGSGPERSGGVYSRADMTDLVGLAGRFGIDVIPEIDIPGHCYALLQALPELADPGENDRYDSIQAFPNNCLNPAVPAVETALQTILGELCTLFPSRWFHVGADEVPADAWSSSPAASAMGATLGATGPAPLQANLLRRIQAMLHANGKITGAWEEAAHGGGIDAADCYLVGWTKPEASQSLAAAGYDVVVAPGQAFYLDMANGPEWHEPGAGWAGWSSPQATYAFTPGAGWSVDESARLIGVQACIWSEPMTERAVFDRLVFPRLSAIAETGWTKASRKDFSRFAAASNLMPNLYGRFAGAV